MLREAAESRRPRLALPLEPWTHLDHHRQLLPVEQTSTWQSSWFRVENPCHAPGYTTLQTAGVCLTSHHPKRLLEGNLPNATTCSPSRLITFCHRWRHSSTQFHGHMKGAGSRGRSSGWSSCSAIVLFFRGIPKAAKKQRGPISLLSHVSPPLCLPPSYRLSWGKNGSFYVGFKPVWHFQQFYQLNDQRAACNLDQNLMQRSQVT